MPAAALASARRRVGVGVEPRQQINHRADDRLRIAARVAVQGVSDLDRAHAMLQQQRNQNGDVTGERADR
jgi:hypothetical protein